MLQVCPYYRASYYNAQIQRFMSEDPVSFAEWINLYAYVGNEPIGFHSRDQARVQEVEKVKKPFRDTTWSCLDNRSMKSAFQCVLFIVLRGLSYPLLVLSILVAVVLYQLVSGKLLNLRWNVWLIRDKRPKAYWIVLVLESAVTIFGLWRVAKRLDEFLVAKNRSPKVRQGAASLVGFKGAGFSSFFFTSPPTTLQLLAESPQPIQSTAFNLSLDKQEKSTVLFG